MKIKLCNTNYVYFIGYIPIFYKYFGDNLIIEDEECGFYINVNVDNLDFLPKLDKDLEKHIEKDQRPIWESYDGIIFNTIGKDYYELFIYDGLID